MWALRLRLWALWQVSESTLYWFNQWVVNYRQVGMQIVIVPTTPSSAQPTSTTYARQWACRGKCNCGATSFAMTTVLPPPPAAYDCCVYENGDAKPIVNDFCVDQEAGCPAIPGWREVGFFSVASCDLCVFNPPEAGVDVKE